MELISDIRMIYDNYDFAHRDPCRLVRNTVHILDAAKIGADVVTAPTEI